MRFNTQKNKLHCCWYITGVIELFWQVLRPMVERWLKFWVPDQLWSLICIHACLVPGTLLFGCCGIVWCPENLLFEVLGWFGVCGWVFYTAILPHLHWTIHTYHNYFCHSILLLKLYARLSKYYFVLFGCSGMPGDRSSCPPFPYILPLLFGGICHIPEPSEHTKKIQLMYAHGSEPL